MRERVICFIDDTENCFSDWAREIIKNVSDQTYTMVGNRYPVYFNTIPETDKQVIVIHTGIDIMYVDAFTHIDSTDDIVILRDNLVKGIFYLDGSNEEQFVKGMGWQYQKFVAAAAVLFYAINTEEMVKLPLEIIHQMIIPAAGIHWVEYLIKYGYDETTVVKFVDCNFFALSCMREIVEWDGTDYASFLEKLGTDKFSFLGMPWNSRIKNIHNLDHDWNLFLQKYPHWLSEWDKIKNTVKFEFKYVDLYDTNNNVSDWVDNRSNTFINVSNIFNYFGAGPLYSSSSRLVSETNFINQLKQHCPDAFISFAGRISELFSPGTVQLGFVKDINTVSSRTLNLPWHKNV